MLGEYRNYAVWSTVSTNAPKHLSTYHDSAQSGAVPNWNDWNQKEKSIKKKLKKGQTKMIVA